MNPMKKEQPPNTAKTIAYKSSLIGSNVIINGRRTSVRLEPEMWKALRQIATREKCSIHDLCSLIYLCKTDEKSLTSAIRVFIMLYFKTSATEEGHARAGHGDFETMKERAKLFRFSKDTLPGNLE